MYDPAHTPAEICAGKLLGVEALAINEQGKRAVQCPTLFYMPHCCLELYNNMLWANWGPASLKRIAFIGNNLSSYAEALTDRQMQTRCRYVAAVQPFVTRTVVPNTFHFRVR